MLDIHPPQISKLLKEDLLNILHVCNQLQDVGEVSLMFQGIKRILSFKLFGFTGVFDLCLPKQKSVLKLFKISVAYFQTLCNNIIQSIKLIL